MICLFTFKGLLKRTTPDCKCHTGHNLSIVGFPTIPKLGFHLGFMLHIWYQIKAYNM